MIFVGPFKGRPLQKFSQAMLELTTLSVFIGYLIYLRYYADQRTQAEKEADEMREGIDLYDTRRFVESLQYFTRLIDAGSHSGVAFLYRARCYRALGYLPAAMADLERGKSYNDTISDLHLETGLIHAEQQKYPAAFLDFDKAIFYSHGEASEPYRQRGLVRQRLEQTAEAEQDFAKATRIEQTPRPALVASPSIHPFVDRVLVRNALLTTTMSLVLLFVIKHSPVIHWPYLVAAASAAGIGFIEPRRGWALAILQVLVLGLGYHFLATATEASTQREVEAFSLYGSMGLTFVGSFVGSMLQRAMA